MVNQLKQENKELTELHIKVYRPWGTYEVLIDNNG